MQHKGGVERKVIGYEGWMEVREGGQEEVREKKASRKRTELLNER